MFGFLKRLEPLPVPPSYRVVHNEDYGFVALHRLEDTDAWYAINDDLTTYPSQDRIYVDVYIEDIWVDTEAKAGDRINRHATANGGVVVWEG